MIPNHSSGRDTASVPCFALPEFIKSQPQGSSAGAGLALRHYQNHKPKQFRQTLSIFNLASYRNRFREQQGMERLPRIHEEYGQLTALIAVGDVGTVDRAGGGN